MSFTVPYHLDPLDYERKAFGPFTSRELKYGGIGIVLAAVVGGALWFAPLSVPELFRVMPAIAVAFPFFYVANTKAPPGYESPEEYMRERLASALSGEDVYVYGCDDEDEYEDRRSPLIPILFAVGTAFVIATVFLVMTIVFKNLNVTPEQVGSVAGISSGSTVSVNDSNEYLMPNLIGMSWDEAKSKYSQYMTLVPEQEWSEVTKDQIFDQEYPEGRKVKIGTEVTVKVSMGIRQIEVQDLENLSAAIAESKLQKEGFKVKKNPTISRRITLSAPSLALTRWRIREAPLCWLSAWVPRTPL